MKDSQFRNKLGIDFKEDVQKYEQNPGCACNLPIYIKILKFGKTQLKEYYGNQEIIVADEQLLIENNWKIINCHINELEEKLKNLASGRKQIAVARWQDQVTVIVNELDY